ncbi:hypothetical protein T440DRAFT_484648 [Plenodomus tracheiphilus IPT5]|uniref:BZIP domain-containing protein n=1 Tax=Plenodomus tracheiphilus IPT5 TaxID=1408161 RepID=A0A6A7BPP8_9PLEO|nr:hypothetical protein T440DRAFT_484648 [Plenodomus tracheiphilus IPT5]
MVNQGASEAAPPQTPAAPAVKRKRRASCLGEQERRERKRAIDREAQRSLREKTKTHIAELERTIQILRDQDRNGATASLLSEIEELRAENDRLRDVIESVRGVVGGDVLSRNTAPANPANGGGGDNSPAASSADQSSPKRRATSFATDVKPPTQSPLDKPDLFEPVAARSRSLDLDGMTMMPELVTSIVPDQDIQVVHNFQPVAESPEEEFFGPSWRCPSPVVLHIGNPEPPVFITPNEKCPTWKKANEIYGDVFKYRKGTGLLTAPQSDAAEAGLLYLGIKHGWNMLSDNWRQSPALVIQKQIDMLLFRHLPKMIRLALAYKSFKLLKYYLKATKEELDKVPEWLRPSHGQLITKHPASIDFFAWPSLRNRLISCQETIFKSGEFSRCYSDYAQFDWPFAFEDTFFLDETTGTYYPSPLFERYHNDLQYWTVNPKFSEKFPEVVADIDMDRRRFKEIEGHR